MKSLILKDLYNISHNVKSMFFILIVLAIAIIPNSGVSGYIGTTVLICSMMVVTTFAFDDVSKWNKYALVMPISKKQLVISKFIVLLIFSAIGSLVGLLFGSVIDMVINKTSFTVDMLFSALVSVVVAMVCGGMMIPLIFKFGTEKGRILMFISVLVPIGIGFLIYTLLKYLGFEFTEQFGIILMCISPIIAFIWDFVMYKITCSIFEKQDI